MAIILPKTLKGFSVFVDGRGYAGRLNSGQLPKLTVKGEDHRDGGMDMPVELDMGMDKMEVMLGFAEYDPDLMALFGLLDGQQPGLTLRGSLEGEDGENSTVACNTRGIINELDPGEWKTSGSGLDKSELKFKQQVRFYSLLIDGDEIHYIDAENAIRRINGVDQLAARRQALGI